MPLSSERKLIFVLHLLQGFDVYIPETSVEEVLDVMASACTDLAELPELRDVILAVSSACRKHKASQFLMSQLRMSGQISIHAGSQPVQAKAQNFYFHVGDRKVRMTEVKTELKKASSAARVHVCVCVSQPLSLRATLQCQFIWKLHWE